MVAMSGRGGFRVLSGRFGDAMGLVTNGVEGDLS